MPAIQRDPTFGVSPAFVFSRHTTAFTTADFVASISAARSLGFEAFEPEIFLPETLGDWAGGGAQTVAAAGLEQGMVVSQFVAHFLLDNFASIDRLTSDADTDDLSRALEAVSAFEGCPVFTVPQAPYRAANGESYADAWSRLVSKIARYKETVEAAGFRLALEVLNGSLVANSDGFLRLANELGDDRLGINLDTGHAWAAKENIPLLPSKLGSRLVGLHLKDNDGNENLPLAPGKGTIPWPSFLTALQGSGYAGSLDVEIACPPDQVDEEYASGLAHLKGNLNQQSKSQS